MATKTMKLAGVVLGLLLWGVAQAGTRHYYYTDPQGTPLAKADAQGNIVERYEYTPYGVPVPSVGASPDGPSYTGHVNDPETGLVYMQARYYDPVVGQFLSIDPVGSMAGNSYNFNRYAYANNNPIMHKDPTGMACGGNGEVSDAVQRMRDLSDHCGSSVVGGVGGGVVGAASNGWFAAAMRGIAAHKFIQSNMAQALPDKEVKSEFRIYDSSTGQWFRADILVRNGPLSPWMVFEIKPVSHMDSGYLRNMASSQLNKYVTSLRTGDNPVDAQVGNWSALFPGTRLRTVNIPVGIKYGGINVSGSYMYGPATEQAQSGVIYYYPGD